MAVRLQLGKHAFLGAAPLVITDDRPAAERGGVGRGYHAADLEVAALDRGDQVVQGRRRDPHQMHRKAQLLPDG